MFKKLLSTIATTLLVTGIAPNLAINPSNLTIEPQAKSLEYLTNDGADQEISLVAKPTDIGGTFYTLIYTVNFKKNNPENYHYVNHSNNGNKAFNMIWGNDRFDYDNVLFNNTRNIKIYQHSKISASDTETVRGSVITLMYHHEDDFLAEAIVRFSDIFSYYQENNNYYVQWIIHLTSAAISSFSNVYSTISIGSSFTFS